MRKITQSIDFFQIQNKLISYCSTNKAKQMIENLFFSKDFQQINLWLKETYQFKMLLLSNRPFIQSGYQDIGEIIQLLGIKFSCIELNDMSLIRESLNCAKDILQYFDSYTLSDISQLKEIAKEVLPFEQIIDRINTTIDSKGEILDSCSPIVRQLKRQIYSIRSEIDLKTQSILNYCKKEGYTEETTSISIHNGVEVIPIKATYRKMVKGILHDSSASGQTYFIQPEQIVELNFKLKELTLQLKAEIHRILMEFSDFCRDNLVALQKAHKFLTYIDFLKAKALYAIDTNSTMPEIQNQSIVSWFEARHPLLEESLRKKNKTLVPLHIELSPKDRILVISGPNAGGKSICLKTIATLQFMLQCGMLIPVKQTSIAGIFNNIYFFIGDEQSIENDLSTYSSFLLNMKLLCQRANEKTLFLIDEFASGTDPQLGSAMGESILEYLISTKALGVVTTHYGQLKRLAFEKEGIINGAMLFDTKNIQPLYELSIGTIGSSFTFALAEKVGLNKNIIQRAKEKIGKQNLHIEEQLQQIAVEKKEINQKLELIKQKDDLLFETIQKYETLNNKLTEQKNKILSQAKTQAKTIISSANKQIEHAIEKIKLSSANKTIVKQEKEQIQQFSKQLEILPQEQPKQNELEIEKTNYKILKTPITEGDYVMSLNSNMIRKVINIKKQNLLIQGDQITIRTSLDKVVKIDKTSVIKQQKQNSISNSQQQSIMDRVNSERLNFTHRLDLRGYRTIEAINEVDELIDKALLIGERRIEILHGTGNGILKTMIRQHLKETKEVKDFYSQKIDFGGEGITIVELDI